MARPHRFDHPGTLHHAMNRGNGRRAIFETRADIRYFLSLVARCARAKQIRVIAYVIMTTHFHLYLESVDGNLSRTLQWVQSKYATYFNRTRDKDGHAFGGRFRSKPVLSDRYSRALVWYMDRNPVEAELTHSPEQYPYGSARHYCSHSGPPWLSRSLVESMVQRITLCEPYRPDLYLSAVSGMRNDGLLDLMQALEASDIAEFPADFDDLVGAAAPHVQAWLARKAASADGERARILVVSPRTVAAVIDAARAEGTLCIPQSGKGRTSAWTLLEAGLLHGLCGCSTEQVALRQGVSLSNAGRRIRQHRAALLQSADHLSVSAEVLRRSLARDFGTA